MNEGGLFENFDLNDTHDSGIPAGTTVMFPNLQIYTKLSDSKWYSLRLDHFEEIGSLSDVTDITGTSSVWIIRWGLEGNDPTDFYHECREPECDEEHNSITVFYKSGNYTEPSEEDIFYLNGYKLGERWELPKEAASIFDQEA